MHSHGIKLRGKSFLSKHYLLPPQYFIEKIKFIVSKTNVFDKNWLLSLKY